VHARTTLLLALTFAAVSFGQAPDSSDQVAENAAPALAVVLAGRNANQAASSAGAAVAIRSNGILITPYHVIKDARALQVRFKSGEVFDQVQLLGVDARRDIAAIKVTGTLSALPVRTASEMRTGATVFVVSNLASPRLSVSAGSVAAYRIADEVAGAGSGYQLIQLKALVSVGSSGGIVLDSGGNAVGLIVSSPADFAVPIDSVIGLGDAAVAKTFANGSKLKLENVAAASIAPTQPAPPPKPAQSKAPPKADRLAMLRSIQTIYIDADEAKEFGASDLKAALESNRLFPSLMLRVVDDPWTADAILVVRKSAFWEFPFELRSPDRATLLLFGSSRAYEGKTAATNIAIDFVQMARSARVK
jgi:hypothetical protein